MAEVAMAAEVGEAETGEGWREQESMAVELEEAGMVGVE